MNSSQFNLKRFFLLCGVGLTLFMGTLLVVLGELYFKVLDADKEADEIRPKIIALSGLRYDVVSAQQYLTDVAATRQRDSYAPAEQHFKSALRLIDTLSEADPDMRTDMQQFRVQFEDTYKLGLAMAEAYIRDGTAAGNVLMNGSLDSFDNRIMTLVRLTESYYSQMASRGRQAELILDLSVATLNRYNLAIVASLILGVLGIFWYVYAHLRRIIGAEPVMAQQLLRQLATSSQVLDDPSASASKDEMDIVALTQSVEKLMLDREDALRNAEEARVVAEAASRSKSQFLANMSMKFALP